MPRLRWVVIAAIVAIGATHGAAAQGVSSTQRPSFAGTWAPSEPGRSEVLFSNGLSAVAGVGGQGRLLIEQRPDRLILTRQLSDDTLDTMLNFKGRFDTTTVYRIVVPQVGRGGLGAGGDTSASWQGDRLILPMLGAAQPTTVAFSLEEGRLKVDMHKVLGPGKENNTPEWFTKAK